MIWAISNRADQTARVIADRHYNRQKVGSVQFVPPGRCLVLLADHALWVTSWPFAEYVKHAWAGAWVNSLFRREEGCSGLASEMIREAVAATLWKYGTPPPLGMISFVDGSKIKKKRDPGRCYLRAGFRRAGMTKGGLICFQLLPADMPSPCAPVGGHP
jgi:hypothetical protein